MSVLIIGAVIFTSAPYFHKLLPKHSEEYYYLKKELKCFEREKDEVYRQLQLKYNNSEDVSILLEEYFRKTEQLDRANSEYKGTKVRERFLKFNTKRLFVYVVGFPVTYLFLALVIIYIASYLRKLNLKLSAALFITGLISFTSSLFYLNWIFLKASDYQLETYNVIMVITSIASIITMIFYYKYKKQQAEKIRTLTDFAIETKHHHYSRMTLKAMNPEIQEISSTSIQEDIEEYDNEYWKVLKEVEK